MNVRDAAKRLETSPATVYALVGAGRLRCYRVGLGRGSIRIAEEHVREFLEASETARKESSPPVQRMNLKHIRLN